MKIMSTNATSLQIPVRLQLLAATLTALHVPATSLPPLTLERGLDESGAFTRLHWVK